MRTYIIKYGEAVNPSDFKYMLSNMKFHRNVDIEINGSELDLAAIVNEHCGKVRFSHHMMDRIPASVLKFSRLKYHF